MTKREELINIIESEADWVEEYSDDSYDYIKDQITQTEEGNDGTISEIEFQQMKEIIDDNMRDWKQSLEEILYMLDK